MNKVLIACIGNIFLGDDAFGVEVAQRLTQVPLPDQVTVKDFGVRSFDLAYALMDAWDLVILVDAVPRGGTPGTIYVIEPDVEAITDGSANTSLDAHTIDAHTMNPVSVIQMVGALGGKCSRMLVVGCEPASVEPNDGGEFRLSEPVAAAIDEAVRTIQDILAGKVRATAA